MAPSTASPANAAAPSASDIERAAAFACEPFLLDGEGPEALAPGTARRRALDAALVEIDAGNEEPSLEWRRNFSLLLGLERLISMEPPTLNDGAELNPHQIDALSGTLTELLAEQQVAVAARPVEVMDDLFGRTSLSLWVTTAPRGVEHFHWHLDLSPRLEPVAAFEMATGVSINVTSPEQAASRLREAIA